MRAKCLLPRLLPLSIDTRLSDHDCIGFFIVPRCSCSPSFLLKRDCVRFFFSFLHRRRRAAPLFLLQGLERTSFQYDMRVMVTGG